MNTLYRIQQILCGAQPDSGLSFEGFLHLYKALNFSNYLEMLGYSAAKYPFVTPFLRFFDFQSFLLE